ncbi:protein translocase subunit SecD [Fusibacter sp. JL216-2]|uniref:protein translocase subunit SecD n=1 Tax=Fusibacter sp. JL216-2 TaxID=3071453 RepID=UPI003D32FA32
MKRNSFSVFLILTAVIVGCILLAFNGLTIGSFRVDSVEDSIKLGLDIEGGVVVVYEAQTEATGNDLAKIMDQSISVISKRVNELGLTEPLITKQGDKRIRIELPGVKDIQEAVDSIGKTAQLRFVLVDAENQASSGMTRDMFTGEDLFTGELVKDASYGYSDQYGHTVMLKMNGDGKDLFRDATLKASQMGAHGGQIAILLDDEVISAPYANQQIPNGEAVINGSFTQEGAANLAALIRGGALPVELKEVQSSLIGPTLGKNALDSALNAAQIGFGLVILFMIVYYRVPGFVASMALLLYACLLLFTMIGFSATLTLPGVAGIVLSVGMAVDANVIIFERIKEEIGNGKTLRASIDSGFSRALKTIIDANITTLIAAVVLFYFGEGPIKGFAVTLMIGIVISMITAVVVTKSMLRSSIALKAFNNKKMFGARG